MAADVPRYRLGSWILASAIPLPELPLAEPAHAPDWTIIAAHGRHRSTAKWFHHWRAPDGRRWLSFGRLGREYLLRFAHHGSFRVSVESRTIVCEAPHVVPAPTLRHLLLNQVWPLALGTERLVLHASAVALPEGALVLAGPGGAGKSTLAAALVLAGHALVADDATALERTADGWRAHPGYPTLRLWPESMDVVLRRQPAATRLAHYTRKRRIDIDGVLPVASAPVPVAAICLLGGPADRRPLRIVRLRPREAAMGLIPYTMQLDVHAETSARRTMEDLASVVERVPVVALSYEHRFDRLPALADALIDAVRSTVLAATALPLPIAR